MSPWLCSPLQRHRETAEETAYRKNRDECITRWCKLGLLNCKHVWSKHRDVDKVSMCREAVEKLNWSVPAFDTRMEDWVSNQRRKNKKRQLRCKYQEASTGDEATSQEERTPQKKPKHGVSVSFFCSLFLYI
jgi:hypothetical protein